ncbi:DUF6368 family protein [Micromonospora auratinigra]|uniref:Uncharacterized protein n=1 Tax=Micromonospora auratinigra TaxID=261654 RepID=A0A1A8ZAQ6_9ACTN|nr:DUF6368 family protein [Micromonospora auratinigra]SBT40949.1 hypothetical protein GA0070611_1443 [Micromonospora auratinigra]
MAGPTASVLLPAEFTADDRRALRGWLAEVGRYDDTYQQWWPADPTLLDLPAPLHGSGPFDVWAEPWEGEAAGEAAVLTRHLGHPPVTQLVVAAAVNTADAHVVLGHLVLALARRHGRQVDFDGLLPLTGPDHDPAHGDPAQRRDRLRAAAAAMPGRLIEVPYPTAAGERWAYHVGDAEFLTHWLRHRWFRMVT